MRACLDCGVPFTEKDSPLKKRCSACQRLHKIEITKKKEEERRRKDAEMKKKQYLPNLDNRILAKADVDYCEPCEYHGKFDAGYLCNYILDTGQRRGCKAGVGCTKRWISCQPSESF